MRRIAAFTLALSFAMGLNPQRPIQASPLDAPVVAGNWKMVVFAGAEIEVAVFDAKVADGKINGTVSGTLPGFPPITAVEGSVEGDRIAIKLLGEGEPSTFRGSLEPGGKQAKGIVRIQGTNYPGRIERTEAKAPATPQQPPLMQKLMQTRTIQDPKARVAKIRSLLDEAPESPANAAAYAMILGQSEAAGLAIEDVTKLVGKWVEEARSYGPEWTAETQTLAVAALKGKKAYAGLATELAQTAEKAMPADASTEQRYTLANLLAASAKLAGKNAVATEAEARVKELDAKLDAEYPTKVPPFKPETVAARGEGKGTRVVLMEIFTGSECPPCVAADVAFDALLKTYKPTEFIGLQHHLHIPRSDPMTNADTIARAAYYGSEISGTPSTFFNGKAENGKGGGPMGRSEVKYKEYRGLIDPSLASYKRADIKLTATRSSTDELKITATAKVEGGSKDAKPRLRLVLVEELVRFPGGNKLRFHHNVVRAFPGGVEGKPLEKGEATVEATVKLADLRKSQDAYVAKYPTTPGARGPFTAPLPSVDLDDLAVVALVQDDDDHAIWHAVQVEVKAEGH